MSSSLNIAGSTIQAAYAANQMSKQQKKMSDSKGIEGSAGGNTPATASTTPIPSPIHIPTPTETPKPTTTPSSTSIPTPAPAAAAAAESKDGSPTASESKTDSKSGDKKGEGDAKAPTAEEEQAELAKSMVSLALLSHPPALLRRIVHNYAYTRLSSPHSLHLSNYYCNTFSDLITTIEE
jgi:hypothetical protein